MKRQLAHPASSARELHGPRYWRSLDELVATPAFRQYLEREFPEGASQLDGVDRRQFFKLMAASFALGGIGLAGFHDLAVGDIIEAFTQQSVSRASLR